jgi:hypothetical protein
MWGIHSQSCGEVTHIIPVNRATTNAMPAKVATCESYNYCCVYRAPSAAPFPRFAHQARTELDLVCILLVTVFAFSDSFPPS